ncbi:MAG: M29 family metallopeptidase [Gammaproteobacteria bacterium]
MKLLPEKTIDTAEKHIRDILTLAIIHNPVQSAVVVSDDQSPLSIALTKAYQRCLPEAKFIDFYAVSPADVTAVFETLVPSDLVVLIQSTSFRLDAFRLRVELFKQSLKVIEHPHLARMKDSEAINYIDSLAYDPLYYRQVGHALKKLIDTSSKTVIDSGGEHLIFDSPLEPAKLNIGDYTDMTNIGGQFPIGEVFTEAQNLESVHGRVRIFAFADTTYSVNKVEKPITLVISKGRVTEVMDSTPEFDLVLANIRKDEGEVWLRELGFGMNRAFTPERTVSDVGTYERMCGIHLSIGAKHTVFKKANFKRGETWHHVDVFVITELVYLDDYIVYQNGIWQVLN